MDEAQKQLIRMFAFQTKVAAATFLLCAASSLYIAHQMDDENSYFDLHRLVELKTQAALKFQEEHKPEPRYTEQQIREVFTRQADEGEKLVGGVCALFTALGGCMALWRRSQWERASKGELVSPFSSKGPK